MSHVVHESMYPGRMREDEGGDEMFAEIARDQSQLR